MTAPIVITASPIRFATRLGGGAADVSERRLKAGPLALECLPVIDCEREC
jgi:hypothetical protein